MSSGSNSQNISQILGIEQHDAAIIEEIEQVFGRNNNKASNKEWNCSICTFLNDPAASKCDICRTSKSAETESWSCLRCTFKNLSGSASCSICDAPRPVTMIEYYVFLFIHLDVVLSFLSFH